MSNAERQARWREGQKKLIKELKRRYVTEAAIDAQLIRNLHKEIKRRRKEAAAQRQQRPKGTWNLAAIDKLELVDLLDWIEGELERILATVSVT